MKKTRLFLMLAAGLSAIHFALPAFSQEKGEGPKIKVTTKKADDKVDVQAHKDKTLIDIKCPFGISAAEIVRVGDAWPKALALKLHVNGLENFRLTNGKVTVDAAVSYENGVPRIRLWLDGDEKKVIDAGSTLRLDIRGMNGDGKPATKLPLKDGYFDVPIPAQFLEGNPKSLKASWIDFSR